MKNTQSILSVSILSSIIALTQGANAAAIGQNFTATTDNDWNTDANWQQGVKPGQAATGIDFDRAFLFGVDTVNVTTATPAPSVNTFDISLGDQGRINVGADMVGIRAIRFNGRAGAGGWHQTAGTVFATSIVGLNATDFLSVSGGALNVSGDIDQDGSYTLEGSSASISGGNYTMVGASTLNFILGATGTSGIAVTNAFTLDSTNSLLHIDASSYINGVGVFDLVTFDTIGGAFDVANISITGLTSGLSATVNYDGDSMSLNVVPEPSVFAFLVGLSGLGFVCARRSRH